MSEPGGPGTVRHGPAAAGEGRGGTFGTAALLGLLEKAGLDAAILVEGLGREELLRSRLTRVEVRRLLGCMASSAVALDASARGAMPELAWDGWQATGTALSGLDGPALDDALWFACESLLPATLLWLRVYRKGQPELFRMVA